MNHSTCDSCGREGLATSAVRYEVKIEVKAAYDPLEITDEDLEKDYSAEIAKVLAQLKRISTEDAQNEVYRAFKFDLCSACQRRYIGKLSAGNFTP